MPSSLCILQTWSTEIWSLEIFWSTEIAKLKFAILVSLEHNQKACKVKALEIPKELEIQSAKKISSQRKTNKRLRTWLPINFIRITRTSQPKNDPCRAMLRPDGTAHQKFHWSSANMTRPPTCGPLAASSMRSSMQYRNRKSKLKKNKATLWDMYYLKANTATRSRQIKNRIKYLTPMINYIKLSNKWMSSLTTISQASTIKTADNISKCSRKKDGPMVWRNLARYKTYIRMKKFLRAWKRFCRTFWQ